MASLADVELAHLRLQYTLVQVLLTRRTSLDDERGSHLWDILYEITHETWSLGQDHVGSDCDWFFKKYMQMYRQQLRWNRDKVSRA
jgi:hypothetical protein